MMKDYDEYLKKKLAKIKKDGIMILDPLTGKERFHLANAAKRQAVLVLLLLEKIKE